MWFSANAEHKIFFDTDSGAVIKIIGRPMDLAHFTLIQSNHWTLPVKIIKLFGVDAGELFAHQLIDQVSHRSRR
jgi:hypothetical protein